MDIIYTTSSRPASAPPPGFEVALGWLWTPEYMPSICLLYGFAVALGGFAPPFEIGCWMFDVRCSGPRTVPVRSGSEWAWVSDLLAPSCPRGRCEPDRKSTRLNSSHLGISYA